MTSGVVILPSPLLPGAAYLGLVTALEALGTRVSLADASLADVENGHDLVARWAAQVRPGTWLLAHSNAGYLAPAVRHAAGGHQPIVFMDAALPPASGPAMLAPRDFREFLAEIADPSGTLPPWTRWWPRADLEEVIPPERFDELDEQCPRMPLSYFDSPVAVPSGWLSKGNAYLAFGDTYAAEIAIADREGWPLHRLIGGHLHLLHDPQGVAATASALAERLRGDRLGTSP